jgi:hypothetical protein
MRHEQREGSPFQRRFKLFDSASMTDAEGQIKLSGSVGYRSFRTSGVVVGDLGVAFLSGSQDGDESFLENIRFGLLGKAQYLVMSENGKTVRKNITNLMNTNPFRLAVEMKGSVPDLPILCKATLPDGVTLFSQLVPEEDPHASGLDRYYAYGYDWMEDASSGLRECLFYDNGDPEFLSQLEFEFSAPKLTQNLTFNK